MKIAIVGCGALGSFYGAKLARDNREVHFLLRSDYDVVRRRGVTIHSKDGDFNVRPKCARAPETIGPCDLVIIGLKTTANDEFPKLLPPLVSSGTAVLTLQNGLGNEERLAKLFSVEQIMGGLAFVCLNRIAPGVIHHIDHGHIIIGEFQRWPEPRTHDIATMFRHAGVPCDVTDNLARAHWEKLAWNIPFNGLGVASSAGLDSILNDKPARRTQPCLTTDKLLADPRWAAIVRELMLEVIAAARGFQFQVPHSLADKQVERTLTMGAYKPSTVLDFENGLPLELDALFLEPLRQARSVKVEMPRLAALCRVLRELSAV
ncbi:MAG: 2-dehydropantoate 2-reductase [Verrucomicrobia subdivision 3 bacterium]|nr:2-dehydropantoate 2-reductase [Limisphaerales bacterium]